MDRQINRRLFLRNAGAVAAGLGAVSALARPGVGDGRQAKRWRTAVGLNGFSSSRRSYGYKMELADVLKLIKNCRYDGVELVPWGGPYPATPAEGRDLKKRYGWALFFGSLTVVWTLLAMVLVSLWVVRRRRDRARRARLDEGWVIPPDDWHASA